LKSTSNDIAIIFFSRTAESESVNKKVISNDSKNNLLLTKTLIQHSKKAIYDSGLKVFHFHEGNQIGDNFGERLSNAFESIYNLGYKCVISVGNDSPDISNVDWHSISNNLRIGKNVLGPSKRGGAYLIGIPKKNFKKDAFQHLPWQSNKLFASLNELLSEDSLFLNAERDINTVNDVFLLKGEFSKRHYFHKVLSLLLFTFRTEFIILSDFLNPRIESLHFGLRAPPIK
jgi:glycosyltransferase A (GT-A) superfamily protein (DUF2064 family)